LTPARLSAYCLHMEIPDTRADIPAQIKVLDVRLDTLLKRAGQMRRQSEKIAAERARLRIAHEHARTRVEAMIARLKSLEQHT